MKKLLPALLAAVFALANVNSIACGEKGHPNKTSTTEAKADPKAQEVEQNIQCKKCKKNHPKEKVDVPQ